MEQEQVTECCDCAIIGGGPAGLTAAIYLARSLRQVRLFDTGKPRVRWSPWNRNYPGFPDGISGPGLHDRIQQQADAFQVERIPERVVEIVRAEPGFCVRTAARTVGARRVILATGVMDRWPDVPNWDTLAGKRISVCPICDGYESVQQRAGIMGSGDKVARETLYVHHFTPHVSLFTIGLREKLPIAPELLERLEREGIPIHHAPLDELAPLGEEGVRVCLKDGTAVDLDILYTALGCHPNNDLAVALGAEVDEVGYVIVDQKQQTCVEGLYAVGDICASVNQVTIAVGQAATAATAVHNSLLDF